LISVFACGRPASAPIASTSSAVEAPPTMESTSRLGVDGELTTTTAITFEVRPLNGPGTMGPRVVSEASGGALDEVRSYLAAHADARLRIECAANPTMMSGMPTPKWPANLGLLVARRLVDSGVDCRRIEVVGWLDDAPDAPGERVRFFIGGESRHAKSRTTRLDACSTPP
jgi:hypothetical protein